MIPELYWLPASASLRLALAPRPRAGDWLDDEMRAWARAGVDIVACLLEPQEIRELGLQGQEQACLASGMRYLSFPIADRQVPPSLQATRRFCGELAGDLRSGRAVVVHCRAGIGRSGLIAACVLQEFGIVGDAAFAMLGAARRVQVPDTEQQAQWVRGYAAHRS